MTSPNIESWKLINNYSSYEVSSFGRIRNNKTNRILKPRPIKNGYAIVDLRKDGEKKTYLIHRIVAQEFCENPDEKKYVDHIDHNKLNNHYLNLRWVTLSENNRNQKMHSNNTSGFMGVDYHKISKKWRAKYKLNRKTKHIGLFKSPEEAGRAYDKEMLNLDPIHASLNFNYPQELKDLYILNNQLKINLNKIQQKINHFNKFFF